MKSIIFSLLIVFLLLSSCDEDDKDIFNMEKVVITGIISDTNKVVNLGDTIKLSVQLPDTIKSNTGKFFVQSLEYGEFYMQIEKFDTVLNRAIIIQPPLYWTTQGNISSQNFLSFKLNNNVKPFGVVINFKPQQKGIYYFNIVSQPGKIRINNQYEPRLTVTFNVNDRHVDLAATYVGQAWANDALTREPGTYVFKVN